MNIKAFALASGILWGLAIFVATLVDATLGRGDHLNLLKGFYPGYSVSYLGSVLGLVYGFIDGLICGALFCWLYNKFAGSPGAKSS